MILHTPETMLTWCIGCSRPLCQDGGVTGANIPEISPAQASLSGARRIRDEDLPMLAAVWLAQGHDSEELRELAGLSRQDGRREGRLLLPGVLASLGWPLRVQDDAREWPAWLEEDDAREELPWLGYWSRIEWARDEMDRLLAPYAAAQVVIEVAGDEPDLWVPVGADLLISLLRDWDDHRAERQRIDDQIRGHLRSLRAEDVPPLISG